MEDDKEEDLEIEVKEDKKDFDAEELLTAIAEIIKEYQTEVSEVKEELSTLTERFEAVADMPAAKTVKKSFFCLLYTSPSPRDRQKSRMPSSA